jgi:hypothetical protein
MTPDVLLDMLPQVFLISTQKGLSNILLIVLSFEFLRAIRSLH